MRKHITRLIVATVAALAIPVAAASASGQSYIAGFGQNNPITGPINWFAFFAHSRGGGNDPFGFVAFAAPVDTFPPQQIFEGPVQCLKVSGHTATAIIKIGYSTSLPPAILGGGDVIHVEDLGKPTRSSGPVDKIANSLFPASDWDQHQVCPDPHALPNIQPLTLGNIVVHDAALSRH